MALAWRDEIPEAARTGHSQGPGPCWISPEVSTDQRVTSTFQVASSVAGTCDGRALLVWALGVVLACAAPGIAHADTLKAELQFASGLPFTGVFYATQARPAPRPAAIDQVDKRFTRRLVVGTPGSNIAFLNSDGFDHNIYADAPASNAIFDIGLMSSGSMAAMAMEWTPGTLVRIGCKIHPRMRAYIANIAADRYAVFEPERGRKTYSLALSDVAADAGPVVLLLAGFDPVRVDLRRGARRETSLTRRGKPVGRVLLTRE